MSKSDLRNEWAWEHIEAMADGSLGGEDARRMQRAVDSDPALRKAVAAAKSLRAQLRSLPRSRPRVSLLRTLLRVPGRGTAYQWFTWSGFATATGAWAVAVLAVLVVLPARQPVEQSPDQAIRDFEIALSYLQRSAALTSNELRNQLGAGLHEALVISRDSLSDSAAADE